MVRPKATAVVSTPRGMAFSFSSRTAAASTMKMGVATYPGSGPCKKVKKRKEKKRKEKKGKEKKRKEKRKGKKKEKKKRRRGGGSFFY